jgi:hypothetical protein
MISLFITIQIILLFLMVFHDWIPVPPLNDIPALKRVDTDRYRLLGSVVNGGMVLIPLLLSWYYSNSPVLPFWVGLSIVMFYLFLSLGTIFSWWVPYFFGNSPAHKAAFQKFANTHHFLPPRGDNVIPNTLHVIIHVLTWSCLVLAMMWPIASPWN